MENQIGSFFIYIIKRCLFFLKNILKQYFIFIFLLKIFFVLYFKIILYKIILIRVALTNKINFKPYKVFKNYIINLCYISYKILY